MNPELEKFAAEAGNAADKALNERIISGFREFDFDPQGRIKNRVRLNLAEKSGKPTSAFVYKAASAALASCLIALALFFLPHTRARRPQEIPPDFYAYYNFPSTGEEAMLRLKNTPPDWLADYNFPCIGK